MYVKSSDQEGKQYHALIQGYLKFVSTKVNAILATEK